MKRRSGLTRMELAIATTIVGVAASVAVPNALSRRIAANEAAAVTALRAIADAQAKFQASGVCDVFANGTGEFGLLRELAGVTGVRMDADGATLGNRLDPPLLGPAFGRLSPRGELLSSGYLFRVVLPGFATGAGVLEVRRGALEGTLDTDLSAAIWGCYAWPQRHGQTGRATFFANQTGAIVATESAAYSGRGAIRPENAGAAFAAGGPRTRITGALATGTVGRDGNFWRLVTPRAEARVLVAATSGRFFARDFAAEGSYEIELTSRRGLTTTDETLTVRLTGLEARTTYFVLLHRPSAAPPESFGTVLADAHGRALVRFDGRTDPYPAGVASLTEFGDGWLRIIDANGRGLGRRIPGFVARGGGARSAPSVAANESAVIAALREIAAAQAAFQASGVCDVNWDGTGEFGLLRELSGRTGVRTTNTAWTQGVALFPSLLPSSYGDSNPNHELVRSGYLLHVFLPGAAGVGVAEIGGTGSLAAGIDSQLAASSWCCYAWPQDYGITGRRTYFVNELGSIVASDFSRNSGTAAFGAVNAGSAFARGGAHTTITGRVATGTIGRDGMLWSAVPSREDEHVHSVRGDLAAQQGSTATGTFTIDAAQLLDRTDESIDLVCTGLAARTLFRIALTNETGTVTADFGGGTSDARGRVTFLFDSRGRAFPDGVESLTEFGGGTLAVTLGGEVILRGAIPEFATLRGPTVPSSSVTFRASKHLDAAPGQLPRRGTLDVRVARSPSGVTEELTVSATTFDRASGPFVVVAIDDQGAETVLGAIDVRGLTAAGKLVLDSRVAPIPGGGIVGLSGRRIEIRTSTGFVVLTATLPEIL